MGLNHTGNLQIRAKKPRLKACTCQSLFKSGSAQPSSLHSDQARSSFGAEACHSRSKVHFLLVRALPVVTKGEILLGERG